MPSDGFPQNVRVRQWVGDQVGAIFKVLGQTLGDYFRRCELNDDTRSAVRTYGQMVVHEFLLKVREKDPQATEAFEFLSTIRRNPINHLPVLAVLYDGAPAE